jgi:hypothetical protein
MYSTGTVLHEEHVCVYAGVLGKFNNIITCFSSKFLKCNGFSVSFKEVGVITCIMLQEHSKRKVKKSLGLIN